MRKYILSLCCIFCLSIFALAQHDGHNHDGHNHANDHNHSHGLKDGKASHGHHEEHKSHKGHDNHGGCGDNGHHDFDPGETAFHHISDQNIYSIGPFSLPLPCILYTPGEGFDVFSSGVFEADAHGTGSVVYNGWALYEGVVRRVMDDSFPNGKVEIGGHKIFAKRIEPAGGGEIREYAFVCYNGGEYQCDNKSTADGGMFGGGITSYYDFSITKNVASMFLMLLLTAWLFFTVAKRYKQRKGMAPTGIQSFIEPIFIFIQDEVAKPFLGHRWEEFLPFLQSLFFFILGLNLFGQIPFLGGSNVTGNLAVTAVLALFAFLVTTFNGNKHYWEHIFAMPGVPKWVLVVLTPVEFLGIFIKPLTLALRLFANITAGHMVVVIFVGLIFVFGQSGDYVGTSYGTAFGSTLVTTFMMAIELLVAFIQAFVFTILTASYIGAATEEGHHEEAHH